MTNKEKSEIFWGTLGISVFFGIMAGGWRTLLLALVTYALGSVAGSLKKQ